MPVFVEDAAETVPSVDVKPGGGVRLGDGWGQWAQWPGVGYSLVRPMGVAGLLELVQGVEQVPLVPDQGLVKQLAAAGLYPALHDRVHSRHVDAAEHDLDPSAVEDGIEQAGGTCRRGPGSGTAHGCRRPQDP